MKPSDVLFGFGGLTFPFAERALENPSHSFLSNCQVRPSSSCVYRSTFSADGLSRATYARASPGLSAPFTICSSIEVQFLSHCSPPTRLAMFEFCVASRCQSVGKDFWWLTVTGANRVRFGSHRRTFNGNLPLSLPQSLLASPRHWILLRRITCWYEEWRERLNFSAAGFSPPERNRCKTAWMAWEKDMMAAQIVKSSVAATTTGPPCLFSLITVHLYMISLAAGLCPYEISTLQI